MDGVGFLGRITHSDVVNLAFSCLLLIDWLRCRSPCLTRFALLCGALTCYLLDQLQGSLLSQAHTYPYMCSLSCHKAKVGLMQAACGGLKHLLGDFAPFGCLLTVTGWCSGLLGGCRGCPEALPCQGLHTSSATLRSNIRYLAKSVNAPRVRTGAHCTTVYVCKVPMLSLRSQRH